MPDQHRCSPTSASSSPTTPGSGDLLGAGRGRRARRRGRPRGLGRPGGRRAGRRRRRRRRRPRGAPRASSTATATSSSRATGPRSSPPGWRGSATPPAASAPPSPRPAPRPTSSSPPTSPGWSPRCGRQGTTTVEIKSGYGLSVRDEARSLAVAAAVHRRDHLPRRARGAGGQRRPAEYVDAGHRPDAGGRGAVRPLDRRVLRARRLRRRPGAAVLEAGAARRPARTAARQPARPGTRRPARLRARPRRGRPLHLPRRRRRRRARATRGTIATLLPGVEFSTRQPYPDARRLLDAGVRVALASDCNPGSCFTSSMPLCIALAVREMGMTPAEARARRDRPGRRGAGPRRRRARWSPGRGPT